MANRFLPAQFRAYVGPRPVAENATEEFGKWDWSNTLGSDYVTPLYLGSRSLGATLSSGVTGGINIVGDPLPSKAGVWVGPNGAGQGWEYIAYHSSGTPVGSLKREPDPGHNGTHTSGAPVYLWFPLSMNAGDLNLRYDSSDNMNVRNWTATLSGVSAPSHVLKPEHMLLVTWSLLMHDPELNMEMLFIGFIEKVTMTGNTRGLAEWQIDIVSTSRLMQATTVPGIRVGPLDIALNADADASSTLGAAWKITLPQRIEAAAGTIPEVDLVDLQSDMGPGNAVDGNENTLWVSDGWTGPQSAFENSGARNAWASLFMYPPPTHMHGSRYIEIINHDGLEMTWLWVYSKYSYPGGTRGRWIRVSEDTMFEDQGGISASEDFEGNEGRVVLAENSRIFQELFPAAKPKYLIGAETLDGPFDPELVRRLWWEGGAIFMAWSDPPNSAGYLVHWGDVTYTELDTAWDTQGTTDFDLPASNLYISTASAKPGMVLRRELQSGDAEWAFTWDYIHHPGYEISNDEGHEEYSNWFKVTLPEMSHVLRDDIASGTTTIFVIDNQGSPFVEGLSKHGEGGFIYIDDEIIEFTAKVYETGALTGCTITQTHKAGSRVYARWQTEWWGSVGVPPDPFDYPFKDKVFDLASSAYPLQKLKWGRGFYGNGTARHPYIGEMVWRFSLYPDAGTPFDGNFEHEYFGEKHVDSNGWLPDISLPNAEIDLTAAYFDSTGDGFRPRTLLMQIRQMHNAAGAEVTDRPRLNYVVAEVDRRYFNPETWVDPPAEGYTNEVITVTLLGQSGQWASLFASVIFDPLIEQVRRKKGITDRGTAWQLAADMAEYGHSVIEVQRHGRIYVVPNRYLLSSDHTPDKTFTSDDVTTVEVTNIRPAEVGQIRLEWTNDVTGASGITVYPETARVGENVVEIGPILVNSVEMAEMIALNFYETKRFPYNIFYELADSDMSIMPGEIHQLDYQFKYTETLVRKTILVESVEQAFRDGYFVTRIGGREIGREWV